MPLYRGSQGIDLLPGPKIVGYNSRKRPEMLEITSFVDASRVVYRGSQGIEILPESKNRGSSPLESCVGGHRASKSSKDRNPRKWPEMLKITSFVDAARVVCQGSQGIKTLPGSENRGL